MKFTAAQYAGILYALATTPFSASALPTESASSLRSRNDGAPQISGLASDKWTQALAKAQAAVAQMTLQEKVNMTKNAGNAGCSGNLFGVARLGIDPICFNDSPTGVAGSYRSSQYPAQVAYGATFNRFLAYDSGVAMGKEFKDTGVTNALAVVAGGPMGTTPYGGRNFENWSSDPYLTSVMTGKKVRGMQASGVQATSKHFVGNEQEYLRIGNPVGGYTGGNVTQTLSVKLSDAAMHETYMLPFAEAVREGSASIMCSYNKINGTDACEDPATLALLKSELNFPGFVISDWGAVRNATAGENAGTDVIMPFAPPGWANTTTTGGAITEARLNDQILRVLLPYYALDQDKDYPSVDFDRYVVDSSDHIYRAGVEAVTLLKNRDRSAGQQGGLPLGKQDVGVFGDAGQVPISLNQWGPIFADAPNNEMPTGYVSHGGGSGWSQAPFLVTPLDAMQERARKDKFYLEHFLFNTTAYPRSYSGPAGPATVYPFQADLARVDTAVVFVTKYSREGYDLHDLKLDRGGEDLIKAVASQNNDTIVVINSGNAIDMSGFVNHPNVSAIVWHYFPGQEGGKALSDVLYGDEAPSGRLPFTIAANVGDYDLSSLYNRTGPANVVLPSVTFSSESLTDYRHFDYNNITPLYEFGFGMSYTTFEMSGLSAVPKAAKNKPLVVKTNEVFLDSSADLYDQAAEVTVNVKNTGAIDAKEVVQLYISYPDSGTNMRPVRNLKGFEKVAVKAGGNTKVTISVTNKDLAIWNTERQGWEILKGTYTMSVGSSSRKLPLNATLTF
ncbi:hypothetical protein QFC22_004015 [Naganishia vaughanmartiniae]|uniref:Uncharacterized protein n=1 Tax=Naganishia vaughanmartiniae TaxID=1424756 RepID=A0ACC2X3F0_9TREE|nr:hypothetical protein QFC22_004015 [Naganishia vaughanmartiniae]